MSSSLSSVPDLCFSNIAIFLDLDDLSALCQCSKRMKERFHSNHWIQRIIQESNDEEMVKTLKEEEAVEAASSSSSSPSSSSSSSSSWTARYRYFSEDMIRKENIFAARFLLFAEDDGTMGGSHNQGRNLAGLCLRGEKEELKKSIEVIEGLLATKEETAETLSTIESNNWSSKYKIELLSNVRSGPFFSNAGHQKDWKAGVKEAQENLLNHSLTEILSYPYHLNGFSYFGNYSSTHCAGIVFDEEPSVIDGWNDQSISRVVPHDDKEEFEIDIEDIKKNGMPKKGKNNEEEGEEKKKKKKQEKAKKKKSTGNLLKLKKDGKKCSYIQPLPQANSELSRNGLFIPRIYSTHSRLNVTVPLEHRAAPLLWAALSGQTKVCQFLIEEMNVDLDSRVIAYDATSLDIALKNGHLSTASYLRKAGVKRGKCRNIDGCRVQPPLYAKENSEDGSFFSREQFYGALTCVHCPVKKNE